MFGEGYGASSAVARRRAGGYVVRCASSLTTLMLTVGIYHRLAVTSTPLILATRSANNGEWHVEGMLIIMLSVCAVHRRSWRAREFDGPAPRGEDGCVPRADSPAKAGARETVVASLLRLVPNIHLLRVLHQSTLNKQEFGFSHLRINLLLRPRMPCCTVRGSLTACTTPSRQVRVLFSLIDMP